MGQRCHRSDGELSRFDPGLAAFIPNTTSREIREKLDRILPEEGVPFEGLLDIFSDVIVPASRHNGHPRMFGYVQAPGTAIAALADLLASTLNANLTAWRSAPGRGRDRAADD